MKSGAVEEVKPRTHRRYYYGRSIRTACCTGIVRSDHADEVMATCEQHNAPLHWEDDDEQ